MGNKYRAVVRIQLSVTSVHSCLEIKKRFYSVVVCRGRLLDSYFYTVDVTSDSATDEHSAEYRVSSYCFHCSYMTSNVNFNGSFKVNTKMKTQVVSCV